MSLGALTSTTLWADSKYTIAGTYYVGKVNTIKLLDVIEDDIGIVGLNDVLDAAYTVWCTSDTNYTTELYYRSNVLLNRLNLNKHMTTKNYLNANIDRYSKCWGHNGNVQQYLVNNNFLRFYQSINIIYSMLSVDRLFINDHIEIDKELLDEILKARLLRIDDII